MDKLLKRFEAWYEATAADRDSVLGSGLEIWTTGGWAMIALAAVSLFIFVIGLNVLFRLRRTGAGRIDEPTWRLWIRGKDEREGPVGALFDRVDRVIDVSDSDVHDAFAEVRIQESAPFQRDLRLMKVAVGAAPLVGLLGTVTGMLATFKGLGAGGGGDQTMTVIAAGIKEALYTTETGLVIALPTLFFHYYLSRRFERYRAFLLHAESVWAQDVLEGDVRREESRIRTIVDTLARHEIAKRLARRVEGARAIAGKGPDSGAVPGAPA